MRTVRMQNTIIKVFFNSKNIALVFSILIIIYCKQYEYNNRREVTSVNYRNADFYLLTYRPNMPKGKTALNTTALQILRKKQSVFLSRVFNVERKTARKKRKTVGICRKYLHILQL